MTQFQNAVGWLNELIGPTLIALATGSAQRDIALQWTSGNRHPTREDERRIYMMIATLRDIIEADGENGARAWFIGANCDDMSRCPAELMREGRLSEVEASAKRLVGDEFTS